MKCSRRDLLRHTCLASASLLSGRLLSAREPIGRIKITGFNIHKATLRWRDLIFLEVCTDAGLVGLGEATLEGRANQVETALRWLEDDFIGRDPAGAEEHWNRVYYQLSRWRNGPDALTALSAVDIALWDIEAKRLNIPLWQLLGGRLREKSRVYYTHWSASIESRRTPEAFRELALETKDHGWTAIKWTLNPLGSETERIAASLAELDAIRAVVGSSMDIALEAAETFSIRSAIQFSQAVEKYHPLFIEEPTLREDAAGLGQVAAHSSVPIATGEGLFTRFEFRPLLEAKGASIIQPDVLHAGGITELRKIANLAETYGVEIAPHQCSGPIGHVASLNAMSCCRNFLIHEWEGADDTTYQEFCEDSYPVQKGGYVTLSSAPGLGLTVNFPEFTKKYPFRPGKRHSLLK